MLVGLYLRLTLTTLYNARLQCSQQQTYSCLDFAQFCFHGTKDNVQMPGSYIRLVTEER
jgi:hypothetical protein